VITKDAGLDNATTKALTQHPMTKVPVTIQDPTTNTSIQKDPTKSSKQDPNTNATTQADDGKDNKGNGYNLYNDRLMSDLVN
jgi:Tfp pilus assembly protein PilN